jgi:hypothetical protein
MQIVKKGDLSLLLFTSCSIAMERDACEQSTHYVQLARHVYNDVGEHMRRNFLRQEQIAEGFENNNVFNDMQYSDAMHIIEVAAFCAFPVALLLIMFGQ